LPLAFPDFLVIELDSVDAHVLLGGGYVLFLYHVEHIAVYVLDRQQVKVLPLVVFHEVAEIDFIGFYGGKAVPLLFQQFEVASRQYVFPFRFGMPHVNPAVINIGVGRIAVIEIRQFKSGGRYVGRTIACLFHVRILGEQQGDSLTVYILYPYVVRTVSFFLVQNDASSLFLNLIHVAEFCFAPKIR